MVKIIGCFSKRFTILAISSDLCMGAIRSIRERSELRLGRCSWQTSILMLKFDSKRFEVENHFNLARDVALDGSLKLKRVLGKYLKELYFSIRACEALIVVLI